jgi:hypothetical protein
MQAKPLISQAVSSQAEGLHPDLVSSAAGQVPLAAPLEVATKAPECGDLVLVRVKNVSNKYSSVEITGGQEVSVKEDQYLVGVLGARRALIGYSGEVPKQLEPGMVLYLLNKGGVIGECTGFHRDLEWPTEVEYLGTLHQHGEPLNLGDSGLPLIDEPLPETPLVLVAGTCMDAGKTSVCKQLLKLFSEKNFSVNAGKVSGVACQRDLLAMKAHGACETLSFLDFGLPSTAHLESLVPLARSMIHYLSRSSPDFVLLELGDGVLGGYRVSSLLEDPNLMSRCVSMILCANDLMGAWGVLQWLSQQGQKMPPILISGRVTDSTEGVRYIEENWNFPAANAFDGSAKICTHVLESLMPWLELE